MSFSVTHGLKLASNDQCTIVSLAFLLSSRKSEFSGIQSQERLQQTVAIASSDLYFMYHFAKEIKTLNTALSHKSYFSFFFQQDLVFINFFVFHLPVYTAW